jgi:hypothetical protein
MTTLQAILSGDDPLSTEQLTILVAELEGLVERYNTIRPYLDLPTLSEADRAYVGQPESPAGARDQLRQRIEQVRSEREALTSADDETSRKELEQLNQLRDRLDKLSVSSQGS